MIVNNGKLKMFLKSSMANLSWSALPMEKAYKNSVFYADSKNLKKVKVYKDFNGKPINSFKVGSTYPTKSVKDDTLIIEKRDYYLTSFGDVCELDVVTKVYVDGKAGLKPKKAKIKSHESSYKLIKKTVLVDFDFTDINFHDNPFESISNNIEKRVIALRKKLSQLKQLQSDALKMIESV